MSSHRHSSLNRFFITVGLSSVLVSVGSCESSNSSDSIGKLGQGGSSGADASTSTSSGGALGGGGAMASGGVVGGGGAFASGGVKGVGGAFASGGVIGAGGAFASGGVMGNGGAVATGGGTLVPGGAGGTSMGTGGAGIAGQIGRDASEAGVDSLASTDTVALAELCLSTGGQPKSMACCGSNGDFPDMCLDGACGCAPAYSHIVTVCSCPTGACFSLTAGCGSMGTGGAVGSGGRDGGMGGAGGAAPGTGGSSGNGDGGKVDAPINTDARGEAERCLSTGGEIISESCCASTSDFPNTCGIGACACAPASSHTIAFCSCPARTCFYPPEGCVGTAGSADAATTGDAGQCTAQPGLDTYCGGTNPPYYYACVGAAYSASCVRVAIGSMTDGYCCP
jgi:hypothetical protein